MIQIKEHFKNLPIDKRLCEEKILSDVFAEMDKTTTFIDDALSHETRHSDDAIEAEKVYKQIVSRLPCAKVDLFEEI
jgi:hypothetical protein